MREKETERKEQTSTKVDEAAWETRQQTVLMVRASASSFEGVE
jgi:hypothetical protein